MCLSTTYPSTIYVLTSLSVHNEKEVIIAERGTTKKRSHVGPDIQSSKAVSG